MTIKRSTVMKMNGNPLMKFLARIRSSRHVEPCNIPSELRLVSRGLTLDGRIVGYREGVVHFRTLSSFAMSTKGQLVSVFFGETSLRGIVKRTTSKGHIIEVTEPNISTQQIVSLLQAEQLANEIGNEANR